MFLLPFSIKYIIFCFMLIKKNYSKNFIQYIPEFPLILNKDRVLLFVRGGGEHTIVMELIILKHETRNLYFSSNT